MGNRSIKHFGTILIILSLFVAIVGVTAEVRSFFRPLSFADNFLEFMGGEGLWFAVIVLVAGILLGRYYRKYGSMSGPLPRNVVRAFKYHLFSFTMSILGYIIFLSFCNIYECSI